MCNCKPNISSCNTCQEKRCNPQPLCDCPAGYMSSDCINNVTSEFNCTLIESGLSLTETLEEMDKAICEIVNSISGAGGNLINIGNGSKIYKGNDELGRRELRTINKSGDIITVTEDTDEITIGVDRAALITLIEENSVGGEYSGENLGFGSKVFKDVVGESFRFKTISSKTLSVIETENEIEINISEVTQIPALYVNDLYVPTYEDWLAENTRQNPSGAVAGFQYKGVGSLVKPFTNTTIYPLLGGVVAITADTAIQNALDGDTLYSYVGIGSRNTPERLGRRVIVQNNGYFYTFNGNLSYSKLDIKFEGNVVFTTTDWLINMDNPSYFSTNLSNTVNIEIDENVILEVTQSLGFNNSGNAINTSNFVNGKTIITTGDGLIDVTYNGVAVLTRYFLNGDGNYNDATLHYKIGNRIRVRNQGVFNSKNNNRLDVYNKVESGILAGSVNINLKALNMTGGTIRTYDRGSFAITSSVSGRLYGFTFAPEGLGIGNTTLKISDSTVEYNCNFVFAKLNEESASLIVTSTEGLGSTYVAGTAPTVIVKGLFKNTGVAKWQVEFKNNRFPYTGVNFDEVDLTMGNLTSSSNHIGDNLVETLVVYNNRKNAELAGVPLYSAFLSRNETGRSEGDELNPYPNTANWKRDLVLPA